MFHLSEFSFSFVDFYFYQKFPGFDDHDENGNTTRKEGDDEGATALIQFDECAAASIKPGVVARREKDKQSPIPVDENDKIGCQQCEVWRQQVIEWREKYHKLNKNHAKLAMRHTNQLMKHDDLILVAAASGSSLKPALSDPSVSLTRENYVDPNSEPPSNTLPNAVTLSSTVPTPSAGCEDLPSANNIFTKNEILHLQSISLGKNNDSTFVLRCIEYAYKNVTSVLPNRTLNGTRDRYEVKDGVSTVVRQGKEPVTPEKVYEIKKLFIKRISNPKCTAGEFGDRIKPTYLNQLIATAIKNVSNKEQPRAKKTNRNKDLIL